MKLLTFKCPECSNMFSKRIDYVPDGCAIIMKCHFCRRKIELTPDDVVEGKATEIVDFDAVKRGRLKIEKA